MVLYGLYPVYENRAAGEGRKIALEVLVLPAKAEKAKPDPIFYFAGGPGVSALTARITFRDTVWRQDRDVVFISQRGTGGTVRLDCELPGGNDDLAGYLDPVFDPESLRDCLRTLELEADLRMYSTPTAMDDINEIRAALGYGRINLMGGSYGTRAALVYMRRHPETVRCAVLNGVAPLKFTNPLYHAWGAQLAIERIFAECEDDDACNAAFPDLQRKLETVLARLDEEPVPVTLRHPATGEEVPAMLDREGFAEGLRIMMYRDSRRVPLHVQRAFEGSVDAFAQAALEADRSIRDSIAFGMLLCVTCSEDIARIDPELIGPLTEGTFSGPGRVQRQMEACEVWPRSDLPEGFAEPVCVDVPVLILSGSLDPVTPPEWGELLAAQLPRSRHVIVPGAHGVLGPCVNSIVQEFLELVNVEDLDTSCVRRMGLGPFVLEN
ncbi:MAG: alpha/beta fold hydrolase [Phycisphaerales bacterium]|nr:alpha/beta fold hydrolase [Phycisphaerales bacterium]